MKNENLYNKCLKIANNLIDTSDLHELSNFLYELELEKIEMDKITDLEIEYNDEIEEMEYVGEKETIDISVSGDNLFYCNNILTKNSYGLPAVVDCLVAMYANEELQNENIIIWKMLKNRFGGIVNYKFPIKAYYAKAILQNMKDDDGGVKFISNSKKSIELMEKMKNRKDLSENNEIEKTVKDSINELFDNV